MVTCVITWKNEGGEANNTQNGPLRVISGGGIRKSNGEHGIVNTKDRNTPEGSRKRGKNHNGGMVQKKTRGRETGRGNTRHRKHMEK